MQKIYQVAIVGGGASGLFCAINLCSGQNAVCGKEVLVLERLGRVGKKLIATGNGQGNLTNDNFGEKYYYGDTSFIKQFVLSAKQIDLKNTSK
jgi:predicted flavoprotein YhiN